MEKLEKLNEIVIRKAVEGVDIPFPAFMVMAYIAHEGVTRGLVEHLGEFEIKPYTFVKMIYEAGPDVDLEKLTDLVVDEILQGLEKGELT